MTIDYISIMGIKIKSQLLILSYGVKSMSSETTMIAEQCRLQKWADDYPEEVRQTGVTTGMYGMIWILSIPMMFLLCCQYANGYLPRD